MTKNEEIAERLKLFLSYKRWSKSYLSKVCGIHRQNIDRYLSGKSNPAKIAINLIPHGLSTDWLLTGKGQMIEDAVVMEELESYHNALEIVKKRYSNGSLYESGLLLDFLNGEAVIALGIAMQKEGIEGGDILHLDRNTPARPGDVVFYNEKVPRVHRFCPGDPKPDAIITRITRNYRQPEK